MKKRLFALLAASALLLAGCSTLLERDLSQVDPHNTAPTTEGDPSILRADSYQELVNALIYLINIGAEEGTIRLYTESENVEGFLSDACLEVIQEDPLGAYCVEFIKYNVDPVVTYSQAQVDITYRRTREQVASIVQATGVTAIRGELESALSSFSTERTLRISYFEEDEAFIRNLARQAYYSVPACALGMPEVSVSIYPKSGRQRIVEILLEYPLEHSQLEKRRDELNRELDRLARDLTRDGRTPLALEAARALLEEGTCDPEGGATPYDFFDTGSASGEGISLTFAALCQKLELSCRVVQGTWEGEPWIWTVVRTAEGWRHLDLSRLEGEDRPLYTDQQLRGLGYFWEDSTLPPCVEG